MSLINSPDLGLRLQKFLKQQGPIRLGTLEEVLFPTINVGDLADESQQQIYSCAIVQAANAVNGTRIRLCNPANSRVNVHPKFLVAAAGNTSYWMMQVESFTGAVGTLGTGIGQTNLGSQSPVGVTGDTPAGVAATIGAFLVTCGVTASAYVDLPQGIILTPGNALAFYSSVVNCEGRFAWMWYEEALA